MSDRTIIVQRVVPHYRAPLFRELYRQFGWLTVSSTNAPNTFLSTSDNAEEHLRLYDYDYHDPANSYDCTIPIDRIVADLRPSRVIGEFSFHANLWHALPRLRFARKIDRYALWSHGWNMERGFRKPADWVVQHGRLVPFALADLLLTYTEEGRNWLSPRLPWKRVIAIGNTLDVDTIRADGARATPLRYGSPQLLAVGRLTEDKGFDQLIEVARIVRRTFPDTVLTIIGDGPERSNLERLAGSDAGGLIRFLGAVYKEEELAPHFKGADAFVLAGAAGLSVVHALAYELPVIAYGRGPGLPRHHPEIEYVVPGETGLLSYEVGAPNFAAHIVESYRSSELTSIRNRISPFLAAKLKMDRMVDRFREVDRLL